MNQRLSVPPDPTEADAAAISASHPSSACAELAALSPLAARTLLRVCVAWEHLGAETQACLLRRVSSGPEAESAAARFALAELMRSPAWKAGRTAQKTALEQLAAAIDAPLH